jgi:hypothetical protein
MERLNSVPSTHACKDVETMKHILYGNKTVEGTMWRGSSYFFATALPATASPDVVERDNAFVVVRDGMLVAQAWSARSNRKSAELAVETEPAFRRQGYGRQVATGWVRNCLAHDKVGFFSHVEENAASRGLAKSLGVVHFVDIVSYG